MGVPQLQPGCCFVDGLLSSGVIAAVGGKEDMKELLRGVFVRFEQASGKGREVVLWVDFLELESHFPYGSKKTGFTVTIQSLRVGSESANENRGV